MASKGFQKPENEKNALEHLESDLKIFLIY